MQIILPQNKEIHDTQEKNQDIQKVQDCQNDFLNTGIFGLSCMHCVSFWGQVLSFCKLVPLIIFKRHGAFVTRHATHGEIRIGATVAKTKSWYLGRITGLNSTCSRDLADGFLELAIF
jgi:hypothetical protein